MYLIVEHSNNPNKSAENWINMKDFFFLKFDRFLKARPFNLLLFPINPMEIPLSEPAANVSSQTEKETFFLISFPFFCFFFHSAGSE